MTAHTETSGTGGVVRAGAAILALAAAGGLWLSLETEPLGPWVPAGLLGVSISLALRWRHAWLFLVPALLPVVDRVPQTGSMFLTEGDQLLLAAALVGYGRMAFGPVFPSPYRRGAGLSLLAGAMVLLLAISYAVAMARGFLPYAPLDEQLAGYHSRWNALRIAKGYFLALWLLPLLVTALREEGIVAMRRLAWGVVAGLGAISLVALSEKLAYTGFMNFSSDYRITASFWEMNVGGAALDGWLSLALPFSLWAVWYLRQRHLLLALSLAFSGLAFYVALVTFSRGVYAACVASVLAWGVCRLLWRSPGGLAGRKGEGGRLALAMGLLVVPAVLAWAMGTAFHTGGYRTLLAIVLLVPATHMVACAAHRPRPWTLMVAVFVFLGVAAVQWGLYYLLDKGSYLSLALSAALFMLAGWFWHVRPSIAGAGRLLGLWGALALGGALVALHWGGEEALQDCLRAEGMLAFLLLLGCVKREPASWSLQSGLILSGASVGMAAVVAISGGYYMGSRFSTSQQDMETRESHWREGISWLDSSSDWIFGKGLGRYPETYYWNSSESGSAGGYTFPRAEEGGHFLRLVSARHALSGGNYLRLLQPLPEVVQGPLTVVADLRPRQTTAYHFEVCQRHLLYPEACIEGRYPLQGDPGRWQSVRLVLGTPNGEHGPFWAHRTSWFAVALESNGDVADVRNLQLLDASGRNLLANGDFSRQGDFWFQSSDRDHLPWHIKNLFLNLLFDQGILGLAAFCLLFLAAGLRMLFRHGDSEHAPYFVAALAGFFTVGLFDSLVDVPRLATLFYLMCFTMLVARPSRLLAPDPGGRNRDAKAAP